MKILIAEEALETGAGHWPAYIGSLAKDLVEQGDRVDVLAHKNAATDIIPGVNCHPYFTRNCWTDPASQGTAGGLRHNFHFYRELSSWLVNASPPYDWCFSLTMRIQHLLAYAWLSRRKRIRKQTRFLLLFVQGFGIYQGYGKPVLFPNNPTNILARICFRLMSGAVRSGQFVLSAETRAMQAELQQFTGLPVKLFPHPVPANVNGGASRENSDEIVITAPGFARHEKGTDLLQGAIEKLLLSADPNLPKFKFILQWRDAFTMPDGTTMEPSTSLLQDDRVEFVNDSLDPVEYLNLLNRSDLVILPYRRNSYHNRLSRVAIEAAGIGRPLICMKGTWAEEVVEQAGCGIVIAEESVESVSDAILQAIRNTQKLLEAARQGASEVAGFHTAKSFRKALTESL